MKISVIVGLIAWLTVISQSAPIDDDLAPFGMRPGGSFSNDVGFDSTSGVYSFYYKINGNTVTEYFLDTKASILQKGQFEIGVMDATRSKPAFVTTGSGPNFSFSNIVYKPFEWVPLLTSATFTHALVGNIVQLNFTIVFNKSATEYQYNVEFSIQGATVKFVTYDPLENKSGRNWWGFFVGGTRNTPNPTPHRLPYLPDPVFSFDFNGKRYYGSHYLDRSKSNGVKFTQYADVASTSIAATHFTTTSLTFNLVAMPLGEVGYLTISPNIKDVMPSPYITQEDSYLPDLTDRVFLDIWTVDCSPYRDFNVDSVRRWTSTIAETVNITSTLTYNGACGNGVVAYIEHKKTVVAYVILNNGDKNIPLNATINVAGGDQVNFHIYANNDMNCDGTSWYIQVDSSVRKYVAATDFSSTQESNGWSYLQYHHLNDTFVPLTYYPDTTIWRGSVGSYPTITSTGMHPAISGTASSADFSCVQSFIEEMTWYGIQRLSIVVHSWQRFGYDVKLPQHFPPNPARGGETDARAMINSAKALGHLIALHENYVDMYPDSPAWNASQLAYTAGNSTRNAWLNKGTGVQSKLIAHDYQVDIAKTQQPTIASYGPNAGYEDVDPGVEPSVYIDLGATAHYPHSYKQAVINKKNLWNNFKSSYKGPLYGEGREYSYTDDTVNSPGHYMPYYAGYVDGYESQVNGKMGAATMPEFALYINKNNQYNNGMGYIGRYINAEGYDYTTVTLDTYWSDRYRAQQITYGHTGWIHFNYRWGRQTLADTLTEYHLTRGLQQIMFSSIVTSVTHYLNGNWLDLATYTTSGGDLVNDVVKIELEDNTKVIVNNRQSRLWTNWPGSGLEYIRGVQFSHNFGYYVCETFISLVKLIPSKMLDRSANLFSQFPWSAPNQMFSAPNNNYCQIRGYFLGSGTQCDPALVFFPNRQLANLVVSIVTNFGSGTCGDKAELRILRGTFDPSKASVTAGTLTQIFGYLYTNTTEVEFSIDTIPSLGENEALFFWLDQLTSAGCDQISLRVWARADYVTSDTNLLTFTASDVNNIMLPPNGFVAWNSDTNFLSFSGKMFNGTAIATDYSTSKFSTFARTREGTLQTIQNVKTDGAIAFEPTSFGNEHLYFSEITTASKDSKLILQTDTQVYGRLFYVNDSAFELTLKGDQEQAPYLNLSPIPVSVIYGGISQQFLGGLSKLEVDRLSFSSSDNTAVVEIDDTGLVLHITTALEQTVTVAYNRPPLPPTGQTPQSVSSASTLHATLVTLLIAFVVIV